MSQIKQESIDSLKGVVDIVELIGLYVDVRRNGSSFVALCPFHGDKNPSMSISSQKGLYHCHACGAGGDAIKFVMEHDGLPFSEAVEKIARVFNFTLMYESGFRKTDKSNVLADLAGFYHSNLFKNHEVLNYLRDRGMDTKTINDFHIGFCGPSFESVNFLDSSSLPKAVEYGVIVKNFDRYYARFSNRIVFPIFSSNGVVIGFGGRALESDKDVAKYINSPQSDVFNKSRILYGHHLARPHVHKENAVIIVEGYIDVVMLHKAGFKNTVATLGTAFGPKHLESLRKDDVKIFMCYDGDAAGVQAAFKASKILAQHSRDGGVVILRDNMDPADIVSRGQAAEFRSLISRSIGFADFVLVEISKKYDLKNPVQKGRAMDEMVEFVNTLSPFLQDSYVNNIINILGIDRRLVKLDRRGSGSLNVSVDSVVNDGAEERVLLSMLESNECYFDALNYLEEKHFEFYRDEFNLIKNNDLDNDVINAFRFKTVEVPLEPRNLNEQIRYMLLKYARNRLRESACLDSACAGDRIEEIKKLKTAIRQLSNGELVYV